MKTFITGLMSGAMLATSVGCMSVTPIGPLADSFGGRPGQPGRPVAKRTPEGAIVTELGPNMAAMPLMRPAPPPPMPAMLVTPGEVSEGNHQEITRRLLDEMEADRNAIAEMPAYSNVSVVSGK